jgi:diacylglycerol kinase (ATP)
MPTPRSITVIRNPVAGQRKAAFVDEVIRQLQVKNSVCVLETQAAGHATLLAREAAAAGNTLIVAAGGDGTVREVAAGLMGADAQLGIIPAGTANVLARELGYMAGRRFTSERTAAIVSGPEDTVLHPFQVTFNGEERLGLCWLGAGFDAEVLKHVKPKWKALIGRAAFAPAIFKACLRDSDRAPIEWSVEGQSAAGRAAWIVLANIGRYGGPFTLSKRTKAQEVGLAGLMFARRGFVARMIDQLLLTFKPLDDRAALLEIREGVLLLGGPDTPIQLDGDYLGQGPVELRLASDQLIVKTR